MAVVKGTEVEEWVGSLSFQWLVELIPVSQYKGKCYNLQLPVVWAIYKILVVCRCLMSPCGYIINKRLVQQNTPSIKILHGLEFLPFFHIQLCHNQYSCCFPVPRMPQLSVSYWRAKPQIVMLWSFSCWQMAFYSKGNLSARVRLNVTLHPKKMMGKIIPHPNFVLKIIKLFGLRFLCSYLLLDYILVSYCMSICLC